MDKTNAPETADEAIVATAREVADAARYEYDKVRHAIRRDPLRAVAIAAGIGFMIALVATR